MAWNLWAAQVSPEVCKADLYEHQQQPEQTRKARQHQDSICDPVCAIGKLSLAVGLATAKTMQPQAT